MKLYDHKWASFKVSDIFTISTGGLVNKEQLHVGENPRITAKATDNGIDSFTQIGGGFQTNRNCVSISFLGNCFYQPYLASYDMKIHSVTIKGHELNRFIGLFLANQFNREFKKFSYGNQLSSKDLARQHILLPATAKGNPDWQYMEAFMRQKEQQILKPTIDRLCKQLIYNQIGGGQRNLLNHKWKAFGFVDIFDIKKGFYNKKPPCYEDGNIPFIGATDSNNGITGFSDRPTIEANSKVGYGPNESIDRKLFPGNAICVTNNGSVGYAYYQPTEFTCTHDVNPLYLKTTPLNRHLAMFLIACIEKQRVCFTYARKWRPKRMVHSKLMLPIDGANKPDWLFMEQFMKEVEGDALKTTLKYFVDKQTVTHPETVDLQGLPASRPVFRP